jgi:hypothetical protein
VVTVPLVKSLSVTNEENGGKSKLRVHPDGPQEQMENHSQGPTVDWKSALTCAADRRRRETLPEEHFTPHEANRT